jgi:2-polyprenyl-3-methyl-5-hydroxy-6-metoxy-1,4-benzoquinol methylase
VQNRRGSFGPVTDVNAARAIREATAYDEGDVWENSAQWHQRVHHVLECENTQRAERAMFARMEAVAGKRALDLGCGPGVVSARLDDLGAGSVLGIDISEKEIRQAVRDYGSRPGVSFAVQSADDPVDGRFDLIIGRSVLHHIDFRATLVRLYEQNLAPGGHMVFMEPTSHPFSLLFHRLVRSAHTADEWPLTPSDLRWMRDRFDNVALLPVNLLSFPAGIVSSFLLSSPDNALMRLADRLDRRLERRPRMTSRGRQALIDITKHA